MFLNYFKFSKFFLIVSVLSVAIVTPSTLFPFIVGKYVWFRTSIDFALIAFLIGILLSDESTRMIQKIKTVIRHPLVIAVSVFVLMFLLACFFGVDPHFSFWSNFERGEGGIQIIHLYIFFLLLTILFQEEKDWRKIFGWILVGATLMGLYGVFAGLEIGGFIGVKFSDPGFRFQGSIGNPAYVAAYALFALCYALYLFFNRNGLEGRGVFSRSIIGIIFFGILAVFFLAATRGAFLGLLGAISVGGIYFAWHHKSARKWLLGAIIGLLVMVSVGIYFKNTPFIKNSSMGRIFDISISTETFSHRAIMWKSAVDGFKERPIFGWGPENFIHVFDQHFNTKYFNPPEQFGAWFDRAHSIFFDYLAETGILGLLSYIMIFIIFFVLFFRLHQENSFLSTQSLFARAIILAIPIAYLIQGLVLFDVLPIYTNIFLFFAFAVYQLQGNLKSQNANLKNTSNSFEIQN